MPIHYSKKVISSTDVEKIVALSENWIMDMKGKDIKPAKLSRTVSAFANSNGGEIYLGIAHFDDKDQYFWDGYKNEESFNEYATLLENILPSFESYVIEAFEHPVEHTYVFHIIIHKTNTIVKTSDGKIYERHGVQNLPCDTPERMLRLQLDKGLASYEDEITQGVFDEIKDSPVLLNFLHAVVPQTLPYDWLRKQRVMDSNAKISVAGELLYDECPQTVLPKQSGVRILRYRTDESEGERGTLEEGFPISIEGDIYSLINKTVTAVKEIVEKVGVISKEGKENKIYPDVTLHEIITNAVLHRDYSILKDIQIRIFTNRIEIESPGKLPGHITLGNILSEQYSRNPKIIRLISKFPSPPNKDVGEGLNTAFRAMQEMQLKPPVIVETDNSVIVTIKHERLADAETIVLDYLKEHETINNSIARSLTGITDSNKMKKIFYVLKDKELLEIVPGTRGVATRWRMKSKQDYDMQRPGDQLTLF